MQKRNRLMIKSGGFYFWGSLVGNMKINSYLLSGVILFSPILIFCQTQDWRKLIALKSTRGEVEKILGKPKKYFDTYGSYETKEGKFSVWYSTGECRKNVEGRQYKVPAQRMTGLYVILHTGLPLEHFISDKENYKKSESLMTDGNYLYTSPDEAIVYETIVPNESKEFVYTISIQPGKNKQNLLCKIEKSGG